jgi:hypothetical protein
MISHDKSLRGGLGWVMISRLIVSHTTQPQTPRRLAASIAWVSSTKRLGRKVTVRPWASAYKV